MLFAPHTHSLHADFISGLGFHIWALFFQDKRINSLVSKNKFKTEREKNYKIKSKYFLKCLFSTILDQKQLADKQACLVI